MFDRLNELIEQFLVALGIFLNRMTQEEKTQVTLLLSLLMIAAAASRVLHLALAR